jgi:acyl-CoA reductase-like NAD-dependent aldehyde dehydrogenase
MSVTEQARPAAKPLHHAEMLTAGVWLGSTSNDTVDVEDPPKPQKISDNPHDGAVGLDCAVQAASSVFALLSKVLSRDRGRRLLRIAEARAAYRGELARTVAMETDNALRPGAAEARSSIDIFYYLGGPAGEMRPPTSTPSAARGASHLNAPLGVRDQRTTKTSDATDCGQRAGPIARIESHSTTSRA